jgi:uncharacterized protein (DUF433 family)
LKMLAEHTVRDEGICGGEPRIQGARITVRSIVESVRLYHAKDPLLQAFPNLSPEDSDAALVYYAEHPEEIERYVHEHRAAEEDTANVPTGLKHSKWDGDPL